MNYKTDLQSNNTDLQSILNTINALPEACSGEHEDVTEETTVYTNELADLASQISALETALEGKASGSGSTETCKITSTYATEAASCYYFNGNEFVCETSPLTLDASGSYIEVAKNSILVLGYNNNYATSWSISGSNSYLGKISNRAYLFGIVEDGAITEDMPI